MARRVPTSMMPPPPADEASDDSDASSFLLSFSADETRFFTRFWRYWFWSGLAFSAIFVICALAGIAALILTATHWGHGASVDARGISMRRNLNIERALTCKGGRHTVVHCNNSFEPADPSLPDGRLNMFGNLRDPFTTVDAGLAVGVRLDAMATFPLLFQPGLAVLVQPLGINVAVPAFSPFGLFIASDERIKRDISDANTTASMELINSLRLRNYRYTEAYRETAGISDDPSVTGFLSHEVEQVLSSAVRESSIQVGGDTISDFKHLNLDEFIPFIVGALQDLDARVP